MFFLCRVSYILLYYDQFDNFDTYKYSDLKSQKETVAVSIIVFIAEAFVSYNFNNSDNQRKLFS